MKTKRALGVAVALMAVAVVSAGCTGTIGPALTSPITGYSNVVFSPGFPTDYQSQHANFSLCSLTGGPVTLQRPHSGREQHYRPVGVLGCETHICSTSIQGASVENEFTSSISLAPRECAVVQIM